MLKKLKIWVAIDKKDQVQGMNYTRCMAVVFKHRGEVVVPAILTYKGRKKKCNGSSRVGRHRTIK